MGQVAADLATWAHEYEPTSRDSELAERSLFDTLAVTLAARGHRIEGVIAGFDEATRWATLGHILDFDDLHLGSTTHASVVCATATLAAAGDERAYLAAAGVMTRLGAALGWSHYSAGWHATCTAGAPGAAVASSISLGLSKDQTANAIALSIPAAGGLQRAFGTDSKSLQVGFAVSAGTRASWLARAGATADPAVVEDWMSLLGGDPTSIDLSGEAVPGGLAIKLFPCCYALQRPIAASRAMLTPATRPEDIVSVRVTTPGASVQPLIHNRPSNGLEGKFSLEYGIAASFLDRFPDLESFTDFAVRRPEAQRLIRIIEVNQNEDDDGASLCSGEFAIEVCWSDGTSSRSSLATPPGAPDNPPNLEMMRAKFASCGADVPSLLADVTWETAPALLRSVFPERSQVHA